MKLRPIKARHVVALWFLVFFPWLPGYPLNQWLPSLPAALVVDANVAGLYALVAISLVVLTGWVGQISLAQGAFVGIGAFATGTLSQRFHIPFPVNLPLVALITAGTASLLGVVALRVRGLYLAVATLIFAWMCDTYLFSARWFVGQGGAASTPDRSVGRPGTFTFFDLTSNKVLYLIILAAVGLAWYTSVNLRDSKTGRAFFAIRGSEMAAVSLGINLTKYKLLAFALSGALAGISGNLLIINTRAVTPIIFQFTVSLFFLSIAVVGGITSLSGAVASSILFAGLSEVFYRAAALNGWLDIVTVGLLLVVLLGYPGGLGALGAILASQASKPANYLRNRFPALAPAESVFQAMRLQVRRVVTSVRAKTAARAAKRPATATVSTATASSLSPPAAPKSSRLAPVTRLFAKIPVPRRRAKVVRRSIDMTRIRVPQGLPPESEQQIASRLALAQHVDWRSLELKDFSLPPNRDDRLPVLTAESVTVKFGGLTAVSDFFLQVRQNEIVGLIGPNGAGKTTMFNAIAGLNSPASGKIVIFDEDATNYPVHLRAQMGVGRTFQLIQLFPQLTMFENLLVATHVHNSTGVFSHLTLTPKAVQAEREARDRVRQVIGLLGLEEFADRRIHGLPFGVLRQIEVARVLVTAAPLIMLDEPASGLDNAETDELARLLYFIRAELGVSILLIEHDVRMVTSVSDYIYVINRGTPLAQGTSADIQKNPEVIAAYLGAAEEERAPARA